MKCIFLAVLCWVVAGHYALAIECPPGAPNNRSWLRRHLADDMTQTNKLVGPTFSGTDFPRVCAISNAHAVRDFKIDDEDVHLLADYYYRLRNRAEEDMRQSQRQPTEQRQLEGQPQVLLQVGETDAERKAAQADRDAISSLGGALAGKREAVDRLGELIYASLPGFCLHQKQMLPPSYFNLDQNSGALQYVGPVAVDKPARTNPYIVTITTTVNDARRANWYRDVFAWHNNNRPVARPPNGASGTGSWHIRPPINPPPCQGQPATATGNGSNGGNRQR